MAMIAFEEIADGVLGQRLIVRPDADSTQGYGLIDYYCTSLSCLCNEADVRLHALVEDPSFLAFRIPLDGEDVAFDEGTLSGDAASDLTQRAIAQELASDPQLREHLAQRRLAVRASAAVEAKLPVVRFDGDLRGFQSFLGAREGRPMYFSQGSLKLAAIDRACVQPTCGCMQIVLSFFEVDQGGRRDRSPVMPALDVRLDLDSRTWSHVDGGDSFSPREQAIMEDFRASLGERWVEWLLHRRSILRNLGRSHLQFTDSPAKAGVVQGRNDPCACGSGKKYKKCHGRPGQASSLDPSVGKDLSVLSEGFTWVEPESGQGPDPDPFNQLSR